jgi:GAF domain-containing protein
MEDALAATDDLESAFEVIADEVRLIVGADVGGIFVADELTPGGVPAVLRMAAGGLILPAGSALVAVDGVVGGALTSRAPCGTVTPAADGGEEGLDTLESLEDLETLALANGLHAVAGAPIMAGPVLVGVLVACRRAAEAFDAAALAALGAAAGRAGSIWEERWSLQVPQAKARRPGAAGGEEGADPDHVVRRILGRLRDAVPCDGATVAWDEPEAGTVRFAGDPARLEAGEAFTVAATETTVQVAMMLQEPVVTQDLQDSPVALHRRWAEAGLRSMVEVPLVMSGRSFGALVMVSHTPGAFPPERVRLLTTLAARVGPILHEARPAARRGAIP